jgi:release factor glutamine methyltransferase
LAYVLGECEFFGRPFEVTRDVLIPRPESELLVEAGLEFLRRRPDPVAADVGTGSGCLAVSLAAECETVRVVASDVSRAALRVAERNARQHAVRVRVSLVQADLLPPGRIRFDLVCANLPYIPRPRLSSLEVARREPRLALDGGSDGLKLLGRLIRQLALRLADGGRALLELDEGQAERLRPLLARRLPGWHAGLRRDLAGRERLLVLDQL